MDPLAEMHLLLREHGWEPECLDNSSYWRWYQAGCDSWFTTSRDGAPAYWGGTISTD
jgi:hypothetical protein